MFHPDSEMAVIGGSVQTEGDFKTSRRAEEGVMGHMLPSNILSKVFVFLSWNDRSTICLVLEFLL